MTAVSGRRLEGPGSVAALERRTVKRLITMLALPRRQTAVSLTRTLVARSRSK